MWPVQHNSPRIEAIDQIMLHYRIFEREALPGLLRVFGVIALSVSVLAAGSGTAFAQDRFGDDDHGRAYDNYASGKSKSLSSAAREATNGKSGKVIGARIKKGKNGDEYEIRVLRRDGRVIDYSIDASRSDSRHGGRDDEGSGRGRRGRDR